MLEKLCRVCGRLLATKSMKTTYLCTDFLRQLQMVFGILARLDNPSVHPSRFCHACKVVMQKYKGKYQHRTSVFEGWSSHTDSDGCSTCQHFQGIQRGGRPKKVKRTSGRPPAISSKYCIDWVREKAPPPLLPPEEDIQVCSTHTHIPLTHLTCPICEDVLRQPVELVTCGSVLCAECICKWLLHHDNLACPCCYVDHLRDFNTIRQATSLVVNSISSLCVVCGQCNNHMQLNSYGNHLKNCIPFTPAEVEPNTSIEDLLHQPLSAPLTPLEQKLQTSLARRSLTEGNTLQLKTGGKVLNCM